jgi:hypothetical protein
VQVEQDGGDGEGQEDGGGDGCEGGHGFRSGSVMVNASSTKPMAMR